MDHVDALGDWLQRYRPVHRRIAAANDHDASVSEVVHPLREIVDALALQLIDACGSQPGRLERSHAGGDDHRATAADRLRRRQVERAVVLGRKPQNFFLEMDSGIGSHRLIEAGRDEVLGEHFGITNNIVNVLLRVDRSQRPAWLFERVDNLDARPTQTGVECREQTGRPSADDRDVKHFFLILFWYGINMSR